MNIELIPAIDIIGGQCVRLTKGDNVLKAITSATSLTVDFGGGIKTEEDIEKAFDAGAAMVTVGSIAVTNPELFLSWIDKYGAGRLI